MCHTWKPESPNLPLTSDCLSSLYGKHTQLEHLTLRIAYKTNYNSKARKKGREGCFYCVRPCSFSSTSLCLIFKALLNLFSFCTTFLYALQQTPKAERCSSFNPFLKLAFHFVHTLRFSCVFFYALLASKNKTAEITSGFIFEAGFISLTMACD